MTHAQWINSLFASDKEFDGAKMASMSLTLEMSKLSGWLKADADCRVKKRAHMRGAGRGAGRERKHRAWSSGGASGARTRQESIPYGQQWDGLMLREGW